jgi:ATP-dependent RNA helicase SUPV3L1/SUV3
MCVEQDKGGGVFCGPLRLLALEIYEKLNSAGYYTNLYTGQEHRKVLRKHCL